MSPSNKRSATEGVDRRAFLRAGLGTAAGFAIAGCSGDSGDGGGDGGDGTPQEGGTLVWAHSETPQELDVHTSTAESSYRVLSNIVEPLVGLTRNLETTSDADAQQAGLAEDWTISDDRTEYEFTLREGITFHDGSELTSADVQYTFERVADPDVGAAHAHILKLVDEMETPDDLTLRLTLEDTYQPFLRQMTYLQTAIIPEGSGEDQAQNPVGTGPFQLESRVQGEEMILNKYDDYWNEGPYIDTLEHRPISDPDTRLTSLETGDVNFTNDIPLSQVDRVTGDSSDSVQTETWNPLCFAFLPMNNGEPPFDDQNFRMAIDYAVDKEELVEAALFGYGEPIETPSFPQSPYRNTSLEPRGQDYDRARELIGESEYDIDEFSLEFKVSPNYPWHVDAATVMLEDFTEVGLDIEIQQLQWGDWLKQVIVDQNFTIAMVNWFRGWEPTYYLRNVWHSEGQFNFLNYASDNFDQSLDAAAAAIDQQEAIQGYKESQRVLHDEIPTLQIWFRNGIMGAQQNVRNLDTILNPNNSFVHFDEVYLNQ